MSWKHPAFELRSNPLLLTHIGNDARLIYCGEELHCRTMSRIVHVRKSGRSSSLGLIHASVANKPYALLQIA